MSNAMYSLAKQALMSQSPALNLSSDNIKVALVGASYAVNLATHQYVTDLGANIIARSGNLTAVTVLLGIFNAAAVLYALLTGAAVDFLVIYKDTGSDATSPLVYYIDTATGLPFTPNGTNATITWDTGANKIFAL